MGGDGFCQVFSNQQEHLPSGPQAVVIENKAPQQNGCLEEIVGDEAAWMMVGTGIVLCSALELPDDVSQRMSFQICQPSL